jgi:hypothetical protein
MLNTVEKSAEGVLGARRVRLVRHCNVERRSPGYAAHRNVSALKARTVPREGIEREEHLPGKGQWHCTRRAQGHKPYGWSEAKVGATGEEASVERHGGSDKLTVVLNDSICRTAVYVIRTHGGVGGGSREASPYPN